MLQQSVDGAPALAAVSRLKERRRFDTGPDDVRFIARTRHDLPHLRQGKIRAFGETHRLSILRRPRRAVVVASTDIAAPVKASRRGERPLLPATLVVRERIHRLTGKVWTVLRPFLPLGVRAEDERALHRTDEKQRVAVGWRGMTHTDWISGFDRDQAGS